MSAKSHLNRVVYTDGSNGVVRLQPNIWRAFYEAALYLDMDSVQQTFTMFVEFGGCFTKELDFVAIVELLQGEAPKTTGLLARSFYETQTYAQAYDNNEWLSMRRSLRHWLTNYDNVCTQTDHVSAVAAEFAKERIDALSEEIKEHDDSHTELPF